MLNTGINDKKDSASFRDPSGFIFVENREIYRQVNRDYKENYDYLISSGLYDALVKKQYLISHKEENISLKQSEGAYKILKPYKIPFISYPYEWSFGALRDAALLTLKIQKEALDFGMSLKDASAFNVQFDKGKPILIDTLSFEKYEEGKPWVAYRQFCGHFLAPLVLMAKKDVRLGQMFRFFLDGIPLDLVSSLLPFKTLLSPSFFIHIYLHSKSQKYFEKKASAKNSKRAVAKKSLYGLVESLESAVKKLKLSDFETEWGDYYNITNYTDAAFANKKKIISDFISEINPKSVWDIGANSGVFSRVVSGGGIFVVSFDNDYIALEKSYKEVKNKKEENILPLFLDVMNPAPDLGWANEERTSLIKRGKPDCVLALALIHHLAISNNLPFSKIADFFSGISSSLIIEFVPKEDSKVQNLLKTRKDIFKNYDILNFEKEFEKKFFIKGKKLIADSLRTIYLMARK